MPKKKWKGGESVETAAPDRPAPNRRMVWHAGSSGEFCAGQFGGPDLAKNTTMKSTNPPNLSISRKNWLEVTQ